MNKLSIQKENQMGKHLRKRSFSKTLNVLIVINTVIMLLTAKIKKGLSIIRIFI
jgi:hypothetical protein